MNRKRLSSFLPSLFAASAIALLPAVAGAQVEEGDIILGVEAGRIVTGAVEAGEIVFPRRVFLSEFGELLPNWTDEPGFDSAAGVFSPGLRIGFDIIRAVRIWDGEAFDAIPEERIRISALGDQVDSPIMDVVTAGFALGAASATGKFHHHAGFELLEPAGAGIYLLELELWAEPGAPSRSDPFWIVFNQQRPEPEHEAAAEWVQRVLAVGCRADLDGDGELSFFDFLMFQDLFAAGDLRADFDDDGELTFFDFLAFQDAFSAGCP
jgi:hypothetical protein